VVVVVTASLLYEDGKTLKGIGTRASKSRLSGVAAFFLECLSNRSRTIQEEYKKELLGSCCGLPKKIKGRMRKLEQYSPALRELEVF